MTEHLTPHPGWTPTTARLVAAVGWLCAVVGVLIALAGVVDASVVVAVTGGGLAGLGYTMIRWGRIVRRHLESTL